MKNKKKINIRLAVAALLAIVMMIIPLTGCGGDYIVVTQEAEYDEDGNEIEPAEKISYDCLFYNNSGDCCIGFTGSEFVISPNKQKLWGYNTKGSWTSYYETSSVITFTIDGETMPACGSTAILMDGRIRMQPVSDISGGLYGAPAGEEYSVQRDELGLDTYFGLTHWWYDRHEDGQGGSKLVLIQSQDGHDIGIIEGDEVTWEITGKLPKTTLIMVDDMPVYIHRCNFMIIPRSLIEASKAYLDSHPHMAQ